jgi:chitinase
VVLRNVSFAVTRALAILAAVLTLAAINVAPAYAVSCSGLPAFATCTVYASGASVTFNNSKWTTIAPIPNNRDCPPNSPFDPSTDNWWTSNGACDAGATATATSAARATATATTARATATATTAPRATATATTARATATATTAARATATATTARATATATTAPRATATSTTRPTATSTTGPTPTTPAGGRRIVGYFAQWGIYGRNFFPKNIDAQGQIGPVGSAPTKLTHINYAFANINTSTKKCDVTLAAPAGDPFADYQKSYDATNSVDGTVDAWSELVRGNWKQMKELKARHPGLKVMMSIGGWSWSDGFYSVSTSANRAAFVSSCLDAYIKGNMPFDSANNTGGPAAAAGIFDGIDLDWEYPGACGNNPSCGASSADTANYTGLLSEFRTQMNALSGGSSVLLTTAVPAGSEKIALVDVPGMAASVSWINLMSYDFFGAWAMTTGHHSALDSWTGMPSTSPQNTYYSSYAVSDWTSKGMPASKINLGIGFYGRGWTGVPNVNNGLNQTGTGAAACGGFVGCEAGISDYKYLKTLGLPSFSGAGTHWGYNGSTFWSYDDPTSVQGKMTWAKAQGLGGAIVWSVDGDSGTELMDAVNYIK